MSTVTMGGAGATSTAGEIRARVDALLEAAPPSAMTEQQFWGAQFDRGLAWVDFPEGLGGSGVDAELAEMVADLLVAAEAPQNNPRNLVGLQMVAPSLVTFGRPDQQSAFLRRIFVCEDIWCQLFSEPGAGSDLASLATRAVRDGTDWILDGQKVWTTLAHMSDYGILLARTDPDVPKHAGLTCFLLDMGSPGVEVRPLRQITGEAEYNEVFLTGVRISDESRLGEVGQGWTVAMSTLMNERGVVGLMSRGSAMTELTRRATEVWTNLEPAARTAARRDTFVRLWTEAEVLRLTAERGEVFRMSGAPGAEGSLHKIAFGLLSQRVMSMLMDLRGPASMLIDNYDQLQPTMFTHLGGDHEAAVHPTKAFLGAQALTIAGGTTDVNKNVLGEKVLGLPAEPRADRAIPWNQSVRAGSDGSRGRKVDVHD